MKTEELRLPIRYGTIVGSPEFEMVARDFATAGLEKLKTTTYPRENEEQRHMTLAVENKMASIEKEEENPLKSRTTEVLKSITRETKDSRPRSFMFVAAEETSHAANISSDSQNSQSLEMLDFSRDFEREYPSKGIQQRLQTSVDDCTSNKIKKNVKTRVGKEISRKHGIQHLSPLPDIDSSNHEKDYQSRRKPTFWSYSEQPVNKISTKDSCHTVRRKTISENCHNVKKELKGMKCSPTRRMSLPLITDHRKITTTFKPDLTNLRAVQSRNKSKVYVEEHFPENIEKDVNPEHIFRLWNVKLPRKLSNIIKSELLQK